MIESPNTEHVFAESGDLQKLYISFWLLNRMSAIKIAELEKKCITLGAFDIEGFLFAVYELSAYCSLLTAKHVHCSSEYVESSIHVVQGFADGKIKIENYLDLDPIKLVQQLSLHCQSVRQKEDSNNA